MNETSQIEIRQAEPNDYDALRKIYYDVRCERFSWLNRDKIKLYDFDDSTQGEFIYVALVDGKIAGFISVWEADSFIHSLFISAQFRGFGLGKLLINKAVKKFGLPMTLKCMKENTAAVGFYLSNNWKIEAEESCEEGPYYLMKLEGRISALKTCTRGVAHGAMFCMIYSCQQNLPRDTVPMAHTI